jgi:hypothetical protein
VVTSWATITEKGLDILSIYIAKYKSDWIREVAARNAVTAEGFANAMLRPGMPLTILEERQTTFTQIIGQYITIEDGKILPRQRQEGEEGAWQGKAKWSTLLERSGEFEELEKLADHLHSKVDEPATDDEPNDLETVESMTQMSDSSEHECLTDDDSGSSNYQAPSNGQSSTSYASHFRQQHSYTSQFPSSAGNDQSQPRINRPTSCTYDSSGVHRNFQDINAIFRGWDSSSSMQLRPDNQRILNPTPVIPDPNPQPQLSSEITDQSSRNSTTESDIQSSEERQDSARTSLPPVSSLLPPTIQPAASPGGQTPILSDSNFLPPGASTSSPDLQPPELCNVIQRCQQTINIQSFDQASSNNAATRYTLNSRPGAIGPDNQNGIIPQLTNHVHRNQNSQLTCTETQQSRLHLTSQHALPQWTIDRNSETVEENGIEEPSPKRPCLDRDDRQHDEYGGAQPKRPLGDQNQFYAANEGSITHTSIVRESQSLSQPSGGEPVTSNSTGASDFNAEKDNHTISCNTGLSSTVNTDISQPGTNATQEYTRMIRQEGGGDTTQGFEPILFDMSPGGFERILFEVDAWLSDPQGFETYLFD